MLALLPGFFTGLSLIVAIGAQNAFVLRQGLTKQHVLLVAIICSAIDALLIILGVAGLGAVIGSLPWLLEVIRWFGVAYLTWFGINSVRNALRPQSLIASDIPTANRSKVIATALALSLLNPHVYLDTVILLGSISNQFGSDRWFFAGGAITASSVWFTGLGFGAKAASRFMANPKFWKILDFAIAAIMFSLALTLSVYKFSNT